jgi:serine/threonine-protein kinase
VDARRQVSDTGLLASVSYRESQTAPGIVIDQNPVAGSRVRRSFPVTLIVSKPAIPPVIVPEVVRMTLIDAKNTLERVGLRLGTVTYEQPNIGGIAMARQQIPPCTVTRQDPVKDRQEGKQ